MNNVNLMGRLTATPELKATASGTPVCNFTLAVARPHVKDTTDFIRCVAWRNTADFICKYFEKGKMMAVNGVLTVRSWKDDNGNSHSMNEVLVDSVFFCGDKSSNTKQQESQQMTVEKAKGAIQDTFGVQIYEEDVPF